LDAPTYGREKQDGKNNPLKLTVTMQAQHYCVNRELDSPVRETLVGTVSFDLRLRIQNATDHAIILCRKCVEADSPNLFDIRADGKRGALRPEPMIYDGPGLIARTDHPKRPNSDDPIIPRGGKLEMDGSAGVGFVVFSKDHRANGGWVYPDRYFLQPRFLAWEQTDPGAKDLAPRWKSYGKLYDKEIAAEPMPIEIKMPQAMADCRTR